MNYFAHLLVARAARPVAAPEALGVVLPDLVTMTGWRPDPARLPPEVLAGRSGHHRADLLFHHDRRFTTLVRDLRRTLLDAGLGPGASRAGAHVGVELLLDGTLSDPELPKAFCDAVALGALVRGAIPAPGRDRWDEVTRWVAADRPAALRDPTDVAHRLHRMLARRARLAFEAELVPALVAGLSHHRPAVVAAGPALLANLATALAGAPAGPPSPGPLPLPG